MKFALEKTVLALLVAGTLGVSTQTAQAGPRELELLGTYLGDWKGSGALIGSDKNDPFDCRLIVAKGNQQRINYTGRCSLVNATLSISGTIAYDDNERRYEAAMSSNAGFTGQAIGQIHNQAISFDLREQQRDRGGSDVRIGSRIELDNGIIVVDFEVEFNNSGEVLTAKVPFERIK